MHPEPLVGRTEELDVITAFLARSPNDGPAALVLEGDAGIGKTVLWREAVRSARSGGRTVLASALSLGEAQLAFAGLADLVEEVWADIAAEIAGPQRIALEHALLLREGSRSPPDERAVAFGFLGVVRTLARSAPLTIAIDDIQWLDQSTTAMLRYVLRRLRNEPVQLILARRLEEGSEPDPLQLARAHGLVVESLPLGPLTLGALHKLLRARLGHPLTRPALTKIHAASRGNPLHALELARATEAATSEAPGSLAALMRTRVLALPADTRQVLLLAALSADPSLTTLRRAATTDPVDALAPAIDADLVNLDSGAVRFNHPLIAAAAVEACDQTGRRWGHGVLADVAQTTEERARHLGRAAIGSSEAIAAELDDAAVLARRRGARAVSAELYEDAAALTPAHDHPRRGRRQIEAGHAYFDAGDTGRARSLFDSLVGTLPESVERVEARWWLGTILDETGDSDGAVRVWHEALAATEDRRLTSIIERGLAYSAVYTGSTDVAARHASAAVAAAERQSDSRTLAYALAAQALISVMQGLAGYKEPLERALSLDSGLDSIGEWSPVEVSAECGRLTGEVERTRVTYETVLSHAVETGEIGAEQWAAFGLTSTELLAGRLDRARELSEIVLELADQTGLMKIPSAGLAANVAAYAGELDEARALVEATLSKARQAKERMYELNLLHSLGFIEASADDHAAAAEAYALARSVAEELGARHIAVQRAALHEAEASAEAGLLDQADAAMAAFAKEPSPPAPDWLDGVRLRATATIAAEAGDEPRGRKTLEDALATVEADAPLETGRTLLSYGVLLRRARGYSAARATLESALAIFGEIGANAWATKASTELARIPGRTRAANAALTDAEQRIADLVAAGDSNKEVAAALHLSVKTVEVTLTRVYRKLGVRSRSGLAAHVAKLTKQ